MKIIYSDWTNRIEDREDLIEIPDIIGVSNFSVSYDGGRISIHINGIDVYKSLSAGIDFCVEGKANG